MTSTPVAMVSETRAEFPAETMGGEILVSFVPTVDEQARANRAVQNSSPTTRLLHTSAPFLWVAIIVLTVLDRGWSGLRGFGMVFPILLVISLLGGPLARWSIARNRRQNPHAVGPHTYTFTTAGMQLESPLGTVQMPWTSFVRARETRELLLLFFTRKAAYFVPRRAIREDDERRLKGWLAAALGARAQFTNEPYGR